MSRRINKACFSMEGCLTPQTLFIHRYCLKEEELLGLPQIPSSQVCLHLTAPSCTLSIPTPHPCLQVLSTVLTPTSKVACACFGAVCVCYACWLWSSECQWDPVVAGLTRQPVLQLGTMF